MKKTETLLLFIIGLLLAPFYCADALSLFSSYSKFNPATYTGDTGTLTLPYQGKSKLELWRNGGESPGMWAFDSNSNVLTVPTGNYRLTSYSVIIYASKGETWLVKSMSPGKSDIQVKKGENIKIESGGQFAAAIKSGKTGNITLPYQGEGSIYLYPADSLNGYLRISGKGQSLSVPAGSYKIYLFNVTVEDKNKAKWMLATISDSPQKARTIDVKPGGKTVLGNYKPLVASVSVTQKADQMSLTLQMVAPNGDKCTIMPADEKAEKPGFNILSKDSRILMSGKFQYG